MLHKKPFQGMMDLNMVRPESKIPDIEVVDATGQLSS
jgi:hypothetical protein